MLTNTENAIAQLLYSLSKLVDAGTRAVSLMVDEEEEERQQTSRPRPTSPRQWKT